MKELGFVTSTMGCRLKKEKSTDWWDERSQAEQESIEKGLAEADKGELISHEDVLKEIRSKYLPD